MASSLADWLETHKEALITAAVYELSSREVLRVHVEPPTRAFFDALIVVASGDSDEPLKSLLREWVSRRTRVVDEPTGILPVLGILKRVIWRVYQSQPPVETALAEAIRLDTMMGEAAEFAARLEAMALLEEISHSVVAAQVQPDLSAPDFISVVAHELKTPLTVIEGYASMLKMDLPETVHPRVALMLRGVEVGMLRLRELIQDMIDVSMIEMGLLNLELQPVWLRRLLDIAEAEVAEAVRQRHLTLKIQADTIPVKPTMADPERLLEALLKVLANAIKYTPDGGQITIKGRGLEGFVDITVEDTGIGIAPENLDRIFEKFSAIGDVTRHSSGKIKFKGGGPGLGLVIAKGILEAHGGTIWAESPGFSEETHPGSRFHILIPMREVISSEAATAAAAVETEVEKLPEPPSSAVVQDADILVEAVVGQPAGSSLDERSETVEVAGESSDTPRAEIPAGAEQNQPPGSDGTAS